MSNFEKITAAIAGSGWAVQERENNLLSFKENTITQGKCLVSVNADTAVEDINRGLARYSNPTAKSMYGITIEAANALWDSIIDLRRRLRSALTEADTKRFWMRVGVSFDLTLEEFAAVEAEGDDGKRILREKFRQNQYRLDGDSYSPETDEDEDDLWPHDEINYDF